MPFLKGINTMNQQTLFDEGAPYQRHSQTSKQAAKEINPHLNGLQTKVLDLLAGQPAGLTDEQMQIVLGMNPSTQRPRRIELMKLGLITEAGTRKTRSGRNAVIWRMK